MKIIVSVSTQKVGSKCEKVIEIEDDFPEDQIEEEAQDVMFSMIQRNWRRAE